MFTFYICDLKVLSLWLIHMSAVPTATTSSSVFGLYCHTLQTEKYKHTLPQPSIRPHPHPAAIWYSSPLPLTPPPPPRHHPIPTMFSWIFIKTEAGAQRGDSFCGLRGLATSSSGTTLALFRSSCGCFSLSSVLCLSLTLVINLHYRRGSLHCLYAHICCPLGIRLMYLFICLKRVCAVCSCRLNSKIKSQ